MDGLDELTVLEWRDYMVAVSTLANKIIEGGDRHCPIVAVGRGGLVPAVILSHRLAGQRIYQIDAQAYYDGDYTGVTLALPVRLPTDATRVLLVDDLIHTGATFDAIVRHVRDFLDSDMTILLATVLVRPEAPYTPAYYGRILSGDPGWIVFPYEVHSV